jgi:hypothetical protein
VDFESIFQYFYYIITLEKISTPKTWKFWGHDMMGCMLSTYAFNMCKMKYHNMNRKSNITRISNIMTHDNMIPW